MGHFQRSFVKARAVMGFKTAYAFYHSNGGRRVFPFTYAYYLKVERGTSLPRPPWLVLLLETLRFIGSAQRSRLILDYLRDLSEEEGVYNLLFRPLFRVRDEPEVQGVMRNLRSRSVFNVTPSQHQFMASSPVVSGVLLVLTNTAGALSSGQLAAMLGMNEKSCARALKALRMRGLIRGFPGGRYASRLETQYSMPTDSDSKARNKTMLQNFDILARRRGKCSIDVWAAARLDRAAVGAAVREMEDAVNLHASRGVLTQDDAEAPVWLYECRLRQVTGSSRARPIGPSE